MPYQDYSTTPSANETIGDDIYIGPNMARNDVREALQTFAADGRDLYDFVQTLVAATTANGDFYASLAAGEAATTAGDTFAVATGDGTYTWYRRTSGASTVLFTYPQSPIAVTGDSASIFSIKSADSTVNLNIHNVAPFVSVAGTRTSKAPRITAGYGTDSNFDSFITSNNVARGTTLFRDEFQSMCDFQSLNGAHADFDAFSQFGGSSAMNHARGFQARMKINMTGGALLAEWTGHYVLPIFNGTFNITDTRGLWIQNAQVDSGTQNLFNAYGIYIDNLTNWGPNVFAIYVAAQKSYFGGNIQCSPTGTDIYDARQVLAKAVHATGAPATFNAAGGVLAAYPSAGLGYLKAYANGSGTASVLAINDNGGRVIVGDATGTDSSAALDVVGHVSATAGFYYGTTKVLGARDTGWAADTGTAKKTTNATYTAGATLTYGAAYVQAEQTAGATRLAAVELALQNATQELKALKDALIAHGLIGA